MFSSEEYESIFSFFIKKGLDRKYYYVEDDYIDVAYKDDYLFGKKSSEDAGHIWLKYKNGELKELGEASTIIKSLRNNTKAIYRAYCD